MTETLPQPTSDPAPQSSGVHVSDSAAIGGDVVGRDKIINNIQTIHQRALTAAETAQTEKEIEMQTLAQGISLFVQSMQERASDTGDGPADKGNPYKGLLEYRLGDADIFFGRNQAIAEVLEQLGQGALTILHAESGAGKTSLLQAGISPRLIADGHLPIYLRPYNNYPGFVIKRAFISDPSQTPLLASAPLRDFLRQVSNVVGAQSTLYIFLDQFEEFFTQFAVEGRQDFARELAECMEDESLNVRWLLALRTEYFGNLANLRPQVKNPFANDARLDRLTRDEAREVVAAPAARRGVTFEDGLVDQLLDDLGKTDFAPPQIQLVCSALFDELKPDQTLITRTFYNELEGAAGILREHLDRVLSRDIPPESRAAARRVLQALISSEQRRIIRTRTDLLAELSPRGVTPEMLDGILNQLNDSRLLRVHEASKDVPDIAYELAHDYLLEEIRLNPEIQARKAAQELLEQEVRSFRKFKTLLSDERLKVIDPYRHDLKFSPEAEELLTLSRDAIEQERSDREAQRQKEIDDAHALAAAQRQQTEAEKKRVEEQTSANSKLARRNRIISYVGLGALVLAVIAGVAYTQSISARTEADTQRGTAIVASTLAFAQQQKAEANAIAAATAEYSALAERDNAKQQVQLASSRALSAQALVLGRSRIDLALLLGVQALNVADTTEAGSILFSNLEYDSYIVTFLRQHQAAVTDLAFSPDGKLLASASEDRSIIVWNAETHQPLGSPLNGHTGHVNTLAFSPNGNLLASGGDDDYVIFWDVATRQQLARLLGHTKSVNSVAFSPDGKLLASASTDASVVLWDVATRQATTILFSNEHRVQVNTVAFSPDGTYLAATFEDGAIVLWDVATGKLLGQPLVSHSIAARGLAFSPDGSLMASGGSEGELILWDLREVRSAGPELWLVLREQKGVVAHLAFSADGQRLLAGSGDGQLAAWVVTGVLDNVQPQSDYLTGYERPVTSLAFSSDSHTIVSGYADGVLVVWDVAQFNPMGRRLVSHGDNVTGLAFTPDGATLFSSSWDSRVIVWDAIAGQPKRDLATRDNTLLSSLAYSPVASRLAAGGSEGEIFQWDATSYEPLGVPLSGSKGGVLGLTFNPAGTLLVSGGTDKVVRLWNVTEGKLIKELSVHTGIINSLAVSPDGKLLASGAAGNRPQDNVVVLWDISDPAQAHFQVALASVTGSGIYSVAFTPDGRQLVVGYENGSILFWDVATHQIVGAPLTGQTRVITALTFGLYNGHTRLASVSADGTAIIWDAVSHLPVTPPLVVNYAFFSSVAFSPDGSRLLAGGLGGNLVEWNVDPQAWRERSCAIVARNFTRNEWVQYFSELDLEYQKTCEQWPLEN